jgi:dolichol-phosphate mannosyltransferase
LIAIEISIFTNFVLNNYFTFGDRRKDGIDNFIQNFLRYNFFSLPGGVLNWITTIILTDKSDASYAILNLIGIVIAMLWNYIANSLWTWKK